MIYLFLKRLFDLVISGVFIILLLPIMLPLILILKFTGEGEIFFRQSRIGHKNREITVLKFATMLKNSPSTGTITAENDSRILPLGKLLRKTKINELPQLINVFTGSMSIVGPRPLTEEAFNLYPDDLLPFVYESKVGITGIGSIVFRNEEVILANSNKPIQECYRDDIMPYKGALEIWYLENRSFLTDIKIIILTVVSIIKPSSQLHNYWFKGIPKQL